ncbi:fumarylacetoacetate (FAA) hydrolase [Mesorhizobium sp. L-8-10]|uniref:fumarylacetoacetate hydrolase family protein n=1 Tax=unclassified Mesorhizobium TaxID=325217 RepID=UPI0019281B3A|nr:MULTISPECIES: fumarylacetoacetate hydrolase family protein [unclassified Mesorhizobium]BCH24483.1 fumarylacetoacetate (FAA) hydrolase [Mesorhizobium sp. L-8-3]BCH32216.1 fumarylacetoacetate (FAA) hydrolase [Mesorhizobium sp. L-8-10]
MRLLTFLAYGMAKAGAVKDGGIVDLSRHFEGRSVRQIIEDGLLDDVRAIVATAAPDVPLEGQALDLPIADPGKIFCVGVNYVNRNEEYKDGSEAPKYPSLFMRTPLSFVPHGEAMVIPRESEQLDYEGEIVLVIGKPGRRIARAEAIAHVAGLTIMNEGSVRDWIRHGKFNVTQGKNFDRSGGLGPWIETDLSGIDVCDMRIETRVNGELRQSDTTASMAFSFARIVEYVSTFTTLMPGDLIATGTPTGAGARFDPPKWLRQGDVVEVEVEGVGTLRNTVAAEA